MNFLLMFVVVETVLLVDHFEDLNGDTDTNALF
jgi:hypothetical protein